MALLFEQHLAVLSQQQALPRGHETEAKVTGELSVVGSMGKTNAPSSHLRLPAITTVNHLASFCWTSIAD